LRGVEIWEVGILTEWLLMEILVED
jgi:hypothetical protein